GEALLARRVELRERRVAVPGDVCPAPGIEVRAHSHHRVLPFKPCELCAEPRGLRDITGRMEDRDIGSLGAVAEGPEDTLVRLVRRVSRARELLQPAVREVGRGAET